MWLDPFFTNKALQDTVATVVTFAVALTWLRIIDALAHRGLVEQKLSRKIIHIGTGPLFVLCWNLFSAEPWAKWAAALVPLAITAQFVAVGFGLIKDDAAVKAMTRRGDPREILRGPLYYGIVFVICTVIFWRHSPVGILALMLMCGGDGFADVVGRRWGTAKLPFNPEKSWAGSAGMFVGGFVFAFGYVALFNAFGNFDPALDLWAAAGAVAAISLIAALVESLPLHDIDNITLTATAVLLGMWWL
ncbi:MAG: phosphatidate cytidylyltransferase [Chloroflexi bacterium]|nr:phosphatidate cytidylyltransferase [Chloroflexota bacterium]